MVSTEQNNVLLDYYGRYFGCYRLDYHDTTYYYSDGEYWTKPDWQNVRLPMISTPEEPSSSLEEAAITLLDIYFSN